MVSICVLCCDLHAGEEAQVDKLSEALSQARGPGPSQVQNGKLGKLMCAICADTVEMAIVRKEELISKEKRVRKLESLLVKLKGQVEGSATGYREQMKEVDDIIKDSHKRIGNLDGYFDEMGIKGELKEAIDLRNDMLALAHELRDFGTSLEMRKTPEAAAAPEAGNAVHGSSEGVGGQGETPDTSRDTGNENVPRVVVPGSDGGKVIRKIRASAEGVEEKMDAQGGEDAARRETKRLVVNHVSAFNELIGGEEAAEEESVSPTTMNYDNAMASAEGDGFEFPSPAQAAGESGEVSTTREIVAVTRTGGGRDCEITVDGRQGFALARNGSSEEVGGQEQTPETSRDAGSESNEGQVEVASFFLKDPRPVPETRPCWVLLQRIDAPRAGGGKTRVSEASAEEVEVPGGIGEVSTTPGIATVTVYGGEGEIGIVDGHETIAPPRRNKIHRRPEKQARSVSQKVESLGCLFCSRKFQSKDHFERHMRVHTGERPFWCGVCGREFMQQSNVTEHQRTHTGERPHRCKLCPKRFTSNSSLSRHVRAHLGEKLWKCSECGKAFVQRVHLTAHLVVHTGEKPFKCTQCPRKFTHSSNLSAHRKKWH